MCSGREAIVCAWGREAIVCAGEGGNCVRWGGRQLCVLGEGGNCAGPADGNCLMPYHNYVLHNRL